MNKRQFSSLEGKELVTHPFWKLFSSVLVSKFIGFSPLSHSAHLSAFVSTLSEFAVEYVLHPEIRVNVFEATHYIRLGFVESFINLTKSYLQVWQKIWAPSD